jgi:hypothetical protein
MDVAIRAGEGAQLGDDFGSYLAPGVHLAGVRDGYGFEIWLAE